MRILEITPFYEFQIEIIKALQSFANDFITFIVEAITMIGEEYIAILVLAVIYLLFNKRIAQKVIFEIAVAQSLNGLIKNFVKEPRPHEMSSDIEDMRHAEGYSFPSGHSQMTGVWLNGLAIEIDKAKKIKWPYIVANILLVMVMFSRMYLGQHFLIDVICGGLLGIGCAFLMSYLYDLYEAERKIVQKLKTLKPGNCVAFGSAFKVPTFAYVEKPNPTPLSNNVDMSKVWRTSIETQQGLPTDIQQPVAEFHVQIPQQGTTNNKFINVVQ